MAHYTIWVCDQRRDMHSMPGSIHPLPNVGVQCIVLVLQPFGTVGRWLGSKWVHVRVRPWFSNRMPRPRSAPPPHHVHSSVSALVAPTGSGSIPGQWVTEVRRVLLPRRRETAGIGPVTQRSRLSVLLGLAWGGACNPTTRHHSMRSGDGDESDDETRPDPS